jgi:hypothetical protein
MSDGAAGGRMCLLPIPLSYASHPVHISGGGTSAPSPHSKHPFMALRSLVPLSWLCLQLPVPRPAQPGAGIFLPLCSPSLTQVSGRKLSFPTGTKEDTFSHGTGTFSPVSAALGERVSEWPTSEVQSLMVQDTTPGSQPTALKVG